MFGPDDGGIVDEDVDRPKRSSVRATAASTEARSPMSATSPCTFAPGLGKPAHGLGSSSARVAIPDRDLAAGRQDALGDGEADALRPAGDDRDAAFEIISYAWAVEPSDREVAKTSGAAQCILPRRCGIE